MAVATSLTIEIERVDTENIVTTLYMAIPYYVQGYLTETVGGTPVVGKTIGISGATTTGSAVTNAIGRYEAELTFIATPGGYTMQADFLGDAGHDPSQATQGFDLVLIPTALDITIPTNFPEDQYCIFHGYLLNDLTDWIFRGAGVPNAVINLKVNGSIEATDTTDSTGKFSMSWMFDAAATYSIEIEFIANVLYAATSELESLKIWNHQYPTPEDVEANCYAWVICIDPNALRGGPMYYVLDKAEVLPGLTDKCGSFSAQLNDNTKEFPGFIQYDMYLLGPDKPFILDQDEYWIALQRGPVNKAAYPENDTWTPTGGSDGKGAGRYWIMGGYISKRYYVRQEKGRVTAIILGKDYMDVWKDQLFGTDAVPRNYSEPTGLDVIAVDILADINAQQATGYKYTAHPTFFLPETTLKWNATYYDTYLEVEDESTFSVSDIIKISDVDNPIGEYLVVTGTGPSPPHLDIQAYNDPSNPEYPLDPGNPGIQYLLGYDRATASVSKISGLMIEEWQKEFIEDGPFDIMQEICEEAVYEWKIDYLKRVMLYAKNSPPLPTNELIQYSTNIRDVPEIVLGDTEDIVTDVIVKDGLPQSRPPGGWEWCSVPGSWNEITDYGMRIYGSSLTPYPANPLRQTYTDSTLIWDDEGQTAICCQYQGPQKQFQVHFGYWMPSGSGGGDQWGARMGIDLRIYRKLKLRWRHATRDLAAPGATEYWLHLHAPGESGGFNSSFRYNFGEGIQETLGLSEADTVDSREWTEIVILMPEPDANGNINFADINQMKGWQAVVTDGDPDPTRVDWISLSVTLDEVDPGYAVPAGKSLTVNPTATTQWIKVDNPENLGGYPNNAASEMRVFHRPVDCVIDEGGIGTERVEVQMVNPDSGSTPLGGENIRLNSALSGKNNFTLGAKLHVLAGRTFSFSQLHVERNYQVVQDNPPTLGPRRYRVYDAEELKYQSQADGKVEEIMNVEGQPRQWVKITIDGDPEKEIGRRVRLFLDPHHSKIFQNVPMIIDDIEYKLEAVNLSQTLTLTPMGSSANPREVDDFNTQDRTNLNLKKVARRGRSLWKR